MKITFAVLLVAVILPYNECFSIDDLADVPIVGSIINATSDAKNYITEGSKSLARKVSSYWYDEDYPEADMTTSQILAYHGYAAETHTVVTDDGYILTVHRIPYKKHLTSRKIPNKTVLLQHGFLGSSADWIIPGPGKGLAYILSACGYDVWMTNARGNTYSRSHISKNVDSYAFWNFTFHEIGQYDLPAVIDYITDIKGSDVKINYIGFSMGTTALLTLLSTKLEYNSILNAAFLMAPVAYMNDIKSPVKLLAPYSHDISTFMKLVGENEFLPNSELMNKFYKYAYKLEPKRLKGSIFKNLMFSICGHDEKQFNKSLVPAILSHTPAGTSTKTLIHFGQEITSNGHFRKFDYGEKGNMIEYGTKEPPEYPLERITLPIALLSSNNDWLSSYKDASKLYSRLASGVEHYVVPDNDFNHLDFVWGIDAPTLVYSELLQLLDIYNGLSLAKLAQKSGEFVCIE